jgi:hypothetical protein
MGLGIGIGISPLLTQKFGGASAIPLLLDTYTGAAVAYSLRQLRTAYTGAAIRVRRSRDNAEQDINFVGGDLDTQSLLDFVGYNLWTYSEDISQAAYLKNRLNTTGTPLYLDIEITPDGLTTGDKIIEDTTLASHYISRSTTAITNATDYNISVYLKQGERTKVFVSSNISGIAEACDIDLTNGNTSNNTFVNTPVVTSEANGWYRFSVTITSGTTSSTIPIRIGLNNGTTTSYTGDGTSGTYVWGFQLTQSSSVLPYGKTVADAARNGFVTTWYDQSGNANNATQATAGNQPRIVNGGVVETKGSRNCIFFDGSNDFLINTTSAIFANKSHGSIFLAANRNSNLNSAAVIIQTWANLQGSSRTTIDYRNTTAGNTGVAAGGRRIDGTSFQSVGTEPYTVNQTLISAIFNWQNAILQLYQNSNPAGTLNPFQTAGNTSNTGVGFSIGSTTQQSFLNGTVSEIVLFEFDQSTNRTAIETNINSHYNIYP